MENIFLFKGEDNYRLFKEMQRWKMGFLEKHGDLNFTKLDAEKASINEIINSIETLPFLGEKRLVFLSNFPLGGKVKATELLQKKEEALLDIIQDVPEHTILVFVSSAPDKRRKFYKELEKKAEIKSFDLLSGSGLNTWIKNEFKERGLEVSGQVINYLANNIGGDLWQLENEIEKIVLYLDGKSPSLEEVQEVVRPRLQENIFALTDAMGARNKRKMIYYFQGLLEMGEPVQQIFYMLVRQARLLVSARSIIEVGKQENAVAELKLHPFVVSQVMKQAQSFSFKDLLSIYTKLLKIDRKMKTSKIEISTDDTRMLELEIEKFLIKMAK